MAADRPGWFRRRSLRLIREGLRTRVSIVVETGEAREVHHFATLIGYGASAINPYLAFETIDDQVRMGFVPGPTEEAEARYRKAVVKGVIKAISRMGISTVHSYHGAQVFEAVGLDRDFVEADLRCALAAHVLIADRLAVQPAQRKAVHIMIAV